MHESIVLHIVMTIYISIFSTTVQDVYHYRPFQY